MTVTKLSIEELARYRQLRSKRLGKSATPDTIIVDSQQRKNMQGMIPIQLWADVRSRAATEMVSVKKMLELALETYLAMEPEDFKRISDRSIALFKEQEKEE